MNKVVEQFLATQNQKGQLRFITCGSVDDGKSTLLGRLLYDSKTVLEDQLNSTQNESRKYGTQGNDIDLALLVDGLQAEREQGITIDVAYRYFETDVRKFIAIDTPGHEQYTRNMATGASNADLAIVLIDARHGVLSQTRRHSFIVSLLGIKQVILAVNKMDLINFDADKYHAIIDDYMTFVRQLNIPTIYSIPVSALQGDNVFSKSDNTPWYQGDSLMTTLEAVQIASVELSQPLRMPVQRANRPDLQFRGYSGTVSSGQVRVGDKIQSALTHKQSSVKEILTPKGSEMSAIAGQAITLVLNNEIDISRGDIISSPSQLPQLADQFAAHIIWMDDDPMLPERNYKIRFTTATGNARITDLVHKIDVNTLDQLASKTLELNEVGYCKLAVDKALAFDSYHDNKQTGAFVLIDKYTNLTVGAGVIDFALRRATNIEWHNMKIDKALRAKNNRQKPCVLWFTGLSGSGKSTIADMLEQKLQARGKHTYLLDGDNVRHGLNKDLGFTDQDRVENIRRVAEVSKLMVDAGLIVLTSFISPFKAERQLARSMLEEGEFVEIFVNTPLEICEQRDPKGLYKKARDGELKNFTGIDSEYEVPENAEIVLNTGNTNVNVLADQIIGYLERQQ